MLQFLALFGLISVLGAFYVSMSKSRERKEKLAKIQRELARREKAEASRETTDTQN